MRDEMKEAKRLTMIISLIRSIWIFLFLLVNVSSSINRTQKFMISHH